MPRPVERPRLRLPLSVSVAWGHLSADPLRMAELATRILPWRVPGVVARLQRAILRRETRVAADERAVLDGSALTAAGARATRTARPARPAPQGPPSGVTVLHLVTNSLPHVHAGYTVRTHQTVRAQRSGGLDAQVVTALGFPVAQGRWRAAELDVVDGVPYHRLLPAYLPRDRAARLRAGADAVSRLVETLRPDVLHAATDHRNGQVALEVAGRHGLPVVYEVRGFLEESWLSRNPDRTPQHESFVLARAAETRCMLAADLVVTLGDTMRAEILSRGVAPDRVLIAPNAVDAQFQQPRRDATALRDRLGISPTDLVVGTLSTLYSYEGIDILLEAVARSAPDVRAVVVGDGPERSALEQLADRLGIADRITFTGRVPFDQTPVHHALLDVFVVPRRDRRVTRLVTPLKPVEALACGTPVVVSDLPALRELVRPGETGLLVPPDDPDALAQTLAGLRDPARRAAMGEAARATVAGRSWDANVRCYLDAYGRAGVAVPAG